MVKPQKEEKSSKQNGNILKFLLFVQVNHKECRLNKNFQIFMLSSNGMDFYAPKPNGQLLCKTPMLTLQAYPEDKNMEINTKCRIMCGDALPIPEYTFCTEDGWDVNWEEV